MLQRLLGKRQTNALPYRILYNHYTSFLGNIYSVIGPFYVVGNLTSIQRGLNCKDTLTTSPPITVTIRLSLALRSLRPGKIKTVGGRHVPRFHEATVVMIVNTWQDIF